MFPLLDVGRANGTVNGAAAAFISLLALPRSTMSIVISSTLIRLARRRIEKHYFVRTDQSPDITAPTGSNSSRNRWWNFTINANNARGLFCFFLLSQLESRMITINIARMVSRGESIRVLKQLMDRRPSAFDYERRHTWFGRGRRLHSRTSGNAHLYLFISFRSAADTDSAYRFQRTCAPVSSRERTCTLSVIYLCS